MHSTMRRDFSTTFNRDHVVQVARDDGAVIRLRSIHPSDFCLSLTSCAMGDETRSIATARREYYAITGFMPEESSFYGRFNARTVLFMKHMFEGALANATQEQRTILSAALKGSSLLDVRAVDGSQITLPATASEVLPSTCAEHGGIKLTATLSILFQKVTSITLTNAKTHDRKALRLPRWLHNQLYLLDRGYADHRLWADIEDRKGYFLTPLKSSTMPRIKAIRSGVGNNHIGQRLSGDLRYWQTVDVDAEFIVRKQGRRTFRVVRVPVCHELPDGSLEFVNLWFVTNLPVELFSPEQLATIYRFRWEVEQLFRTLKVVGRLDHLRTANVHVIHCFIYATLLGMVLSHSLCALMRRCRPEVEPSPYRVMALLLKNLPSIVAAVGTRRFSEVLKSFESALWREGVNPNPGRPYRSISYAIDLKYDA